MLADAVLLTLCWRSFVRTWFATQSLENAFCNQGLHSFASKRTLVHLAANGRLEPGADVERSKRAGTANFGGSDRKFAWSDRAPECRPQAGIGRADRSEREPPQAWPLGVSNGLGNKLYG